MRSRARLIAAVAPSGARRAAAAPARWQGWRGQRATGDAVAIAMRTDHGGTKPRVVPARRRFPPTRANSARVPLIDRLDENVPDDNPFIGRKPVGAPREFAGDQIFEGLVIGFISVRPPRPPGRRRRRPTTPSAGCNSSVDSSVSFLLSIITSTAWTARPKPYREARARPRAGHGSPYLPLKSDTVAPGAPAEDLWCQFGHRSTTKCLHRATRSVARAG